MRRSLIALLVPALFSACTPTTDSDESNDVDGEDVPTVQPAASGSGTITITVPGIPYLGPDPRVSAVDVETVDAATDKFKVTVTVTNGPAGSTLYKSYPGGGELYLRAVDNEHFPHDGFLDTIKDMAHVTLPAMAGGATWKVSRTFYGRSTFVATLQPIPSPPDWPAPPPLQDSNLSNNEKSRSTLCDLNLTLNNSMLQSSFPELQDIDVHLTFTHAKNPNLVEYEDGGESHFALANAFSESFEVNEIFLTTIGTMDYYFIPRHMQSTTSTVTIKNGAALICADFETGGPEELYCAVDGGPDSNCPNANATKLRLCVSSPLSYDPVTHFIKAGNPTAFATAVWNITIGLDYDVSDTVNSTLETALEDALVDEGFPQILGESLTTMIHDKLLTDGHGNHGDITVFQAGDGTILLQGKAANDSLAFCPYPTN